MSQLKEVNAAISAAYQKALAEAKRECGRGVFRSRGKHVYISVKGNALPICEAEGYEYKGTKRALDTIMAYANNPDVDYIDIQGGINYAESMRDFDDSNYEPWVAEWRVNLYNRDAQQDKPLGKCKWFLLCENDATTTVKHPVLGEVPCCARCAAFATKP